MHQNCLEKAKHVKHVKRDLLLLQMTLVILNTILKKSFLRQCKWQYILLDLESLDSHSVNAWGNVTAAILQCSYCQFTPLNLQMYLNNMEPSFLVYMGKNKGAWFLVSGTGNRLQMSVTTVFIRSHSMENKDCRCWLFSTLASVRVWLYFATHCTTWRRHVWNCASRYLQPIARPAVNQFMNHQDHIFRNFQECFFLFFHD